MTFRTRSRCRCRRRLHQMGRRNESHITNRLLYQCHAWPRIECAAGCRFHWKLRLNSNRLCFINRHCAARLEKKLLFTKFMCTHHSIECDVVYIPYIMYKSFNLRAFVCVYVYHGLCARLVPRAHIRIIYLESFFCHSISFFCRSLKFAF